MKHAAMLRPFLAAMAAFFFSLSAFAQAEPVPRVAWPVTQVGRVVTYAPMTADAANAARFSFGVAANGALYANAPTLTPTPGGASIPVSVSGNIPPARVARAFGNFFRRALPVVSTVAAVYQLGQELGFGVDPQTGFLSGSSVAPSGPTSGAGFYGLHATQGTRYPASGVYPLGATTRQDQCALILSAAGHTPYVVTSTTCQGTNPANGAAYTFEVRNWSITGSYVCPSGMVLQESACVTGGTPAKTPQEVEDLIAARTSWPANSAVVSAIVEVIGSGENVAVDPVAVAGPASQVVSSSRATDPATGNVTTTSNVHNYSYADNRVTISPVTNVTVSSSTGVVLGSNSKPASEAEPQPVEFPCGGPGLPACSVKVDEAGVPNADSLDVEKGKKAEKELDDFLRDPDSIIPAFPTINWAFVLPSSCGVIPTPQFAPFFSSLDVCQFQPMFHDVMNVVWMLGGLFGAISLFMKSALAD